MIRLRIPLLFIFTMLLAACDQLVLPYPLQPVSGTGMPGFISPSADMLKELPPTWTPEWMPPGTPNITPSPKIEAVPPGWVLNTDDHAILRIGAVSQQIENKIVINGTPLDVAVGENGVWVIEAVDGNRSNILRIDESTNNVIASIPIIYGAALSITSGEGAVWIGIAEPVVVNEASAGIEYSQTGGVVRIDPLTNQITHYIKTGAVAAEVAYYNHELWILEWMFMYSYVDRIDLTGDEFIIRSLPLTPDVDEYMHQFGHIAINEAGIWAVPLEDNSKYIYRMNDSDGKIVSFIQVGEMDADSPADILATEDAVWVALRSGKILRVDPFTEQVVEVIKIGGRLSNLYMTPVSLWVLSRMDSELYQIDLQTRKVSDHIVTGNKPKPVLTPSSTPPAYGLGDTPWHPCASGYESRMRVGLQAMVNPDPPLANRVRDAASKQGTVNGQIEPGEIVEILEGPTCADDWVWWRILSIDTGTTGWTAEGDGSNYWLVPLQ